MPPRVIRPKDDSSSNERSDRTVVKQPGRRRAVPSACIPCRRRKSKCDGGLPACSTCVAVYRTECSYDSDVDGRPRSTAQRDVQALQQRNDALDVIVASLRALPEAEAITLLHSLRVTPNIDVVAASARSASISESSFSRSAQSSSDRSTTDQFHPPSAPSDSPPVLIPPSSATSQRADDQIQSRHVSLQVLQDPDLVQHLLDLYFAWAHPFNQIFTKDYFLADMHNDSNNNFSTLLLYAILAFACHYADRLELHGEQIPVSTVSDYCVQQAEAILASTDRPHITTVQALAVMAMKESSRGRDSISYQYVGRCLRMALELNLHLAKNASNLLTQEAEARKVTLWGIYTIETLCSTHAGRAPQLSKSFIDLPMPTPIERVEMQEWQAYGHELSVTVNQARPLQPILFANCLSSLCELSSSVLETLYLPHQSFTSRSLITAYEKFMQWYSSIPNSFWLDATSPPHVIVLHIYFNMCILSLFKPYIKLDLRGAGLYPRDTCTQSANEISRMVSMIRDGYGLRRVPVLIVQGLIVASTVHVLNLPSDMAVANLRQAMDDLATLATNHQCAINGINLVQSLANRWSVRLPKEVLPTVGSPRITRTPQLASAPTTVLSQMSEPYGVLYDDLGGTDDMQASAWPAQPIHSMAQPYGVGMMAMQQPIANHDWQHPHDQSQPTSLPESDPSAMQAVSWQWNQ